MLLLVSGMSVVEQEAVALNPKPNTRNPEPLRRRCVAVASPTVSGVDSDISDTRVGFTLVQGVAPSGKTHPTLVQGVAPSGKTRLNTHGLVYVARSCLSWGGTGIQ